MVEAQSQVATLELVDDLEEQRLLEELLEATKPGRLPDGPHYLIATPFRYPPLEHGSRYGRVDERGIFYGSERVETALAELAFYTLMFVGHAEGFEMPMVDKTAFTFGYDTRAGVDTTAPAFDGRRERLEASGDYGESQRLGSHARDGGAEVIRFRSVRCPEGGANSAVLSLAALEPEPRTMTGWTMRVREGRVDLLEKHAARPRRLSFAAAEFAARGVDAHPDR